MSYLGLPVICCGFGVINVVIAQVPGVTGWEDRLMQYGAMGIFCGWLMIVVVKQMEKMNTKIDRLAKALWTQLLDHSRNEEVRREARENIAAIGEKDK